MKKTIALLLLFISIVAGAQSNEYEVLSVKNSAMVIDVKSRTYKPLSQMQVLNPDDKVLVRNKHDLCLVEKKTGRQRVYKNEEVGYFTVREMIVNCERVNANPLMLFVNAKSSQERDGSGIRWESSGIVIRSEGDISLARALVSCITGHNRIKKSDSLLMIKHVEGKLFYPEFVNNSSDTLYVNFLITDKKHTSYSVGFNLIDGADKCFEIVLAPESNLTMDGFYYLNSKKFQYYVFGTKQAFNPYVLEQNLKSFDTIAPSSDIELLFGKVRTVKK